MQANELAERFREAGLNLFAVLDRSEIKDFPAYSASQSVLLIGNSGPAMWRRMPAAYQQRDNPVDDYARDVVTAALSEADCIEKWQLLFPCTDSIGLCPPLQQLGAAAGWHHPSPLGSGINIHSGLWFAYRAVIAVSNKLATTAPMQGESPCVSCRGRECTTNCPAGAISDSHPPDMRACATHRLKPGSPCETRCLARTACPVATSNTYSDDQMHHHYSRSLPSLRKWIASQR